MNWLLLGWAMIYISLLMFAMYYMISKSVNKLEHFGTNESAENNKMKKSIIDLDELSWIPSDIARQYKSQIGSGLDAFKKTVKDVWDDMDSTEKSAFKKKVSVAMGNAANILKNDELVRDILHTLIANTPMMVSNSSAV